MNSDPRLITIGYFWDAIFSNMRFEMTLVVVIFQIRGRIKMYQYSWDQIKGKHFAFPFPFKHRAYEALPNEYSSDFIVLNFRNLPICLAQVVRSHLWFCISKIQCELRSQEWDWDQERKQDTMEGTIINLIVAKVTRVHFGFEFDTIILISLLLRA